MFMIIFEISLLNIDLQKQHIYVVIFMSIPQLFHIRDVYTKIHFSRVIAILVTIVFRVRHMLS